MRNPFKRKQAPTYLTAVTGTIRPFALACCGCGCALMVDGSNGPKIVTGGMLDLSQCRNFSGEAASFATVAEAEQAAEAAGWKVVDGNHRCKTCSFEPGQARGMIIDLRSIWERPI